MAKTARFKSVVQKAGQPKIHLALLEPKKDKVLQRAIKAHRVMMVHQETVGTAKDFGTIGFDRKVAGQILVFPKSLEDFAGSRIVGVNYDLIEEELETKMGARRKKNAAKARPSREAEKPRDEPRDEEPVSEPEENPEVAELKHGIKRAIEMLEGGKQVPAFKLLQHLLDS